LTRPTRGKKFFVTSNLIAHNDKIRTYLRDIEPVIDCKPDALIMADAGLIMMVKEKWPEQVVHLSVQANTTNWAAVKFWQKMGVERIILSRELSLHEIEKIRQECPDMELEVFVHGALCIAYSGRCLLSGYFNHRDPNQGTCTNACRWNYATHDADIDPTTGEAIAQKMEGDFNFEAAQQKAEQSFSTTGSGQRHPKADKVYLIEEAGRPGQLMPIMEDEHGTYIMNSKDLRAVEHVARLTQIGVDSLKIEGRTKSLYYVARTAQVYRRAIDDAVAGRPFNPELLIELEGLSNRGYTGGLLERRPATTTRTTSAATPSPSAASTWARCWAPRAGRCGPVGDWVLVETKNHFAVGDLIEVVHPSGNTVRLQEMRNVEGQPVQVAQGSPVRVWIPLPARYSGALLARVVESQPPAAAAEPALAV
jgi:putative protease